MRTFIQWNKNYSAINREERNLAAIFYHLLLQEDNLKRFLKHVDCHFEIIPSELGIYFEYAYIRDLWYTQCKDNEKRKELIFKFLNPVNKDELKNKPPLAFNEYFGAVPQASAKDIQSPGNWSLARYAENIKDPIEFLKTCKFKWSFNAKPDIVIHTSKNQALCIEAKLESGEGHYPQNYREQKIFRERGLKPFKQTELQSYLMEKLLGIETQFVFLVQNSHSSSKTHKTHLWKDVFQLFDIDNAPYFIQETINSTCNNY
jgi:hypothetical protein